MFQCISRTEIQWVEEEQLMPLLDFHIEKSLVLIEILLRSLVLDEISVK